MAWQDFYGFKSGAYGGAGDDEFTSQEFRDARRSGYTGMSILEWMKPGGQRGDDGWKGANRSGLTVSEDLMHNLRSLERTEMGMKKGYESIKNMMPDMSDYARTSDLPDTSGFATKDSLGGYAKTTDLLSLPNATQFSTLKNRVTAAEGAGLSIAGRLSNVEGAQQTQSEQISQNRAEALKVRTTSAQPVQNQATPIGIQQAQSPSAQAGMISAGLAGLSRNNKKFKNKTLNI